jgi:predicted transposase/invertase (TIGR01784 family)
MPTPHDALFKAAFGQADIARSELAHLLPHDISSHLDLATLSVTPGSFVDEDLQHTHSDLLYTVRTKTGDAAFVYVLFEHQSSADPAMPFRFLRYMVRIWERWLRDHPGQPLPIVLPVLLHHGDTAWRASTDFASIFDASSELLAVTRPYQPHFRFLLDDLACLSPEALASRTLAALPRLVQLALWASRSFPRLRTAAPFMRSVAATLVRDERSRTVLTQLYIYLLRSADPTVEVATIRTILLDIAGPQGHEDIVNAGEQLIQQGIEQGERTALRANIKLVLEARSITLSDVAQARLASCSDVPTLTAWLRRAATATHEGDLFAGGPTV